MGITVALLGLYLIFREMPPFVHYVIGLPTALVLLWERPRG
jgi:hypothetical protein